MPRLQAASLQDALRPSDPLAALEILARRTGWVSTSYDAGRGPNVRARNTVIKGRTATLDVCCEWDEEAENLEVSCRLDSCYIPEAADEAITRLLSVVESYFELKGYWGRFAVEVDRRVWFCFRLPRRVAVRIEDWCAILSSTLPAVVARSENLIPLLGLAMRDGEKDFNMAEIALALETAGQA